jgi:hypothetical protein
MKNAKDFFYNHKVAIIGATTSAILFTVPTMASAADTATSLLTPEVTATISGFAANIVPTILALIAILVPVGLTLWAIGFGVKKGIAFLQKKASKAI